MTRADRARASATHKRATTVNTPTRLQSAFFETKRSPGRGAPVHRIGVTGSNRYARVSNDELRKQIADGQEATNDPRFG
jgi:hypothetical protein